MDSELERLASVLHGYRYLSATETDLQDGVAAVLTERRIAFERERALGDQDRIDFFLPTADIGIEVKIHGSWQEVARQLGRYARHDAVQGLILVTTRSSHMLVPSELNGRPVVTVWIGAIGE